MVGACFLSPGGRMEGRSDIRSDRLQKKRDGVREGGLLAKRRGSFSESKRRLENVRPIQGGGVKMQNQAKGRNGGNARIYSSRSD